MNNAYFQHRCDSLRATIDRRLKSAVASNEPRDLSDGARYVLTAPGKRVRSILLLLSCKAVGGSTKDAIGAAAAVEMLHNFTLVHDDVMDNARARRGRATVHIKWNVNNAILVGDVILGLAYRSLLTPKSRNMQRLAQLFTDGFIAVCEGQALDLEYEQRTSIDVRDYRLMIDNKTAKLIATSCELGAVIGNASSTHVRALRKFGTHIGRAFQIQDDLLDVIGNEKDFGKAVGGDIVERKKTFLLVEALKRARGHDLRMLREHISKGVTGTRERRRRINDVTGVYTRSGAVEAAGRQIKKETVAGLQELRTLPDSEARATLQWFAGKLVQRTF